MFSVLSILLTVATLAFIAYPLVRGKEIDQHPDKELQANDLKTHKETIMTTLGEIEFDYHMRKLSEEDYQNLKGKYSGAAVEILKSEQENERHFGKKVQTKSSREIDLHREIEEELAALAKK